MAESHREGRAGPVYGYIHKDRREPVYAHIHKDRRIAKLEARVNALEKQACSAMKVYILYSGL